MPLSPPPALKRASDKLTRRLSRGHYQSTDVPVLALHRIWGIEDIVRLIIEHCNLPSAVALGRTCGYLFSVFVNEVWTRCRDLENLQKQTLGGKDTVVRVYRMLQASGPIYRPVGPSRTLRMDTTTRVAMYCARIRALSVDQMAVDGDPLQALSKSRGFRSLQTAFSSLRRVALTVFTNRALATGVDFITELPALQYVGVHHRAHFVDWAVGDTTGHPALRRLPETFKTLQRLRRLDTLRLQVDAGGLELGGEAFAFISSLAHTELQPRSLRLRYTNISAPYLHVLPRFTSLQSLECSLDQMSDIPQKLGLPQLRQLMISSRSAPAFGCLLTSLQAPGLEAIELKPEHQGELYDVSYSSELLTDPLTIIAEKWPSLVRFAIYYRCPLASPFVPYWYFDAFRPLLACVYLKVFVVNAEPLVRMRDVDILDIVDAWSDLEVLVLGTFIPCPIHTTGFPRLSYDSFAALATCKALRTVVLNAVLSTVAVAEAGAVADSPVSTLVLREYREADRETAPRLMRRLFPHLKHLSGAQDCLRCGIDRKLQRRGNYIILQREPLCCIRDAAHRLGIPGIKECLAGTSLQRRVRGDCILCQMDHVSDFATFAECCNMYGS